MPEKHPLSLSSLHDPVANALSLPSPVANLAQDVLSLSLSSLEEVPLELVTPRRGAAKPREKKSKGKARNMEKEDAAAAAAAAAAAEAAAEEAYWAAVPRISSYEAVCTAEIAESMPPRYFSRPAHDQGYAPPTASSPPGLQPPPDAPATPSRLQRAPKPSRSTAEQAMQTPPAQRYRLPSLMPALPADPRDPNASSRAAAAPLRSPFPSSSAAPAVPLVPNTSSSGVP